MDSALRRSLLAAALAHAGLALLVRVAPMPRADETKPIATDVTEVIEVEEAPRVPEPIHDAPPLTSNDPTSAASSVAVASRPTSRPPLEITPKVVDGVASTQGPNETIGAPPQIATAPSAGAPETIPPGFAKLLQQTGKPSWLGPSTQGVLGNLAVDTTPKQTKDEKLAQKVNDDLTQQVDEASRPAGGGSGGPVVTAAHEVAMEYAPMSGFALFTVKTDGEGAVVSVSVVDVGSDLTGWTGVAKALQKKLQAKKLVVPTGASGVAVTVRVDAKLTMPSGAPSGKAFSPYALKGGLNVGGTFDLSDIGAKPLRVVAVHVVNESRL